MTPTPAGIAGALSEEERGPVISAFEARLILGGLNDNQLASLRAIAPEGVGTAKHLGVPQRTLIALAKKGLATRGHGGWFRLTDLGRAVAAELQKRG